MNKQNLPALVLASSSPRRQELIRSLGLPVTIRVSNADETVADKLAPGEIVGQLSLRKASAVFERLTEEERASHFAIVGSDTIVVLDGQVLNKPEDAADAHRMLSMLQGRSHQVYSGLCLIDCASGHHTVKHSMTSVHMKPVSSEQIGRYIESGEPMDKAGAYAIQGLGATLIDRIEGDYFTVVGLPLSLLSDMLSEAGVSIL